MRNVLLLALGLIACLSASTAFASEIGLPTKTFVQTWTALPTSHFTHGLAVGSFKVLQVHAEPLPANAKFGGLLEDAFASAGNDAERRAIALLEMTAPWDPQTRAAFQRLREAEVAYAGANGARHDRFVAVLTQVVEGTGRSAAVEDSPSVDLDKAYGAALARQSGDSRVAAEAEQAKWRTYSDAFAAFADLQAPDSAAALTDELERQRASELATAGH